MLLFLRSFFFSSRRRHTRSLRDWSSDVCSSDLKQDRMRSIAQPCFIPAKFLYREDERPSFLPISFKIYFPDCNCCPFRHSNARRRSEEHTSELQSRRDLVCRLLLEKKKTNTY